MPSSCADQPPRPWRTLPHPSPTPARVTTTAPGGRMWPLRHTPPVSPWTADRVRCTQAAPAGLHRTPDPPQALACASAGRTSRTPVVIEHIHHGGVDVRRRRRRRCGRTHASPQPSPCHGAMVPRQSHSVRRRQPLLLWPLPDGPTCWDSRLPTTATPSDFVTSSSKFLSVSATTASDDVYIAASVAAGQHAATAASRRNVVDSGPRPRPPGRRRARRASAIVALLLRTWVRCTGGGVGYSRGCE